MKVIFVGSNPSVRNNDVNIPFEGTRSKKILEIWIKFLQVSNYVMINILDEPTSNNRPLTRREIRNSLAGLKQKLKNLEYDKIIALGNSASVALKLLKINHYKLPHPSPRNRILNSKKELQGKLEECKVFIYENS